MVFDAKDRWFYFCCSHLRWYQEKPNPLSMFTFSKVNCRFLCNEYANFKCSSGWPRTMQMMLSTYLLNSFIPLNCLPLCWLLQYVQTQTRPRMMAHSSFVIFWLFAFKQFLHNSHSTPFASESHFSNLIRSRDFNHFVFCSDASNDFIHTFAMFAASDARIAITCDCTCQIPLHLKRWFVTASLHKLFFTELSNTESRFIKYSLHIAISIASPPARWFTNFLGQEILPSRYFQERVTLWPL